MHRRTTTVVAALALVCAAPATADTPQEYLADVLANPFGAAAELVVSQAYTACDTLPDTATGSAYKADLATPGGPVRVCRIEGTASETEFSNTVTLLELPGQQVLVSMTIGGENFRRETFAGSVDVGVGDETITLSSADLGSP